MHISESARVAEVDYAKIIRPIKRDKLTRVATARSFDVGLSWADRAEKRPMPYRMRYGVGQTTPPVTVPFQEDLTWDEEPSPEGSQMAVAPVEQAAKAVDATVTPLPVAPQLDSDLLQRTLARLEDENAFLRNRLIASEENLKTLITMMAASRENR
ncbi:MAG: hypothetical protein H7837_07730 [Magnetococcus sp. MYC-9]